MILEQLIEGVEEISALNVPWCNQQGVNISSCGGMGGRGMTSFSFMHLLMFIPGKDFRQRGGDLMIYLN